jgi:hypothetical protein
MNEWISVKDRLPNKKGDYLCHFKTSYGSWMRIVSFSTNLEQVDDCDFRGKRRGESADFPAE